VHAINGLLRAWHFQAQWEPFRVKKSVEKKKPGA